MERGPPVPTPYLSPWRPWRSPGAGVGWGSGGGAEIGTGLRATRGPAPISCLCRPSGVAPPYLCHALRRHAPLPEAAVALLTSFQCSAQDPLSC